MMDFKTNGLQIKLALTDYTEPLLYLIFYTSPKIISDIARTDLIC